MRDGLERKYQMPCTEARVQLLPRVSGSEFVDGIGSGEARLYFLRYSIRSGIMSPYPQSDTVRPATSPVSFPSPVAYKTRPSNVLLQSPIIS